MWPFKRKPARPAPLNPGPINEDWRVGDLAECITAWWKDGRTGVARPKGHGPEHGDVCRVTAVDAYRALNGDQWFLDLAGYALTGFAASGFRKVPPLNSEAEAEFTAQIKRLKPSRVKA